MKQKTQEIETMAQDIETQEMPERAVKTKAVIGGGTVGLLAYFGGKARNNAVAGPAVLEAREAIAKAVTDKANDLGDLLKDSKIGEKAIESAETAFGVLKDSADAINMDTVIANTKDVAKEAAKAADTMVNKMGGAGKVAAGAAVLTAVGTFAYQKHKQNKEQKSWVAEMEAKQAAQVEQGVPQAGR